MRNEGRITDGGLSASEQQVKEAGEVKGDGCGGQVMWGGFEDNELYFACQ